MPGTPNHDITSSSEKKKPKSPFPNDDDMIVSDKIIETCAQHQLVPPSLHENLNVTSKSRMTRSQCNLSHIINHQTSGPMHKEVETTTYETLTNQKNNTPTHQPKPKPSHTQPQQQKSPTQKSPIQKTNSQKPPLSPLPISNKFNPLIRQNKSNASSSSTLGSSSGSRPLFPPGFEKYIPAHHKIQKEKKREKKLEKKRKLRKALFNTNQIIPTVQINPQGIQAEDVIHMARILGLSYNGPTSELKNRIEVVLNNQRQNWVDNSN